MKQKHIKWAMVALAGVVLYSIAMKNASPAATSDGGFNPDPGDASGGFEQ